MSETRQLRYTRHSGAEDHDAARSHSEDEDDDEEEDEEDGEMDVEGQSTLALLELAERDLAAREQRYDEEVAQFSAAVLAQQQLVEATGTDYSDLEARLQALEQRRQRQAQHRGQAAVLVARCLELRGDTLAAQQRQAMLRHMNATTLLAMTMAQHLLIYSALLDQRYCVVVLCRADDVAGDKPLAYAVVSVDTLCMQ